MKSPSTALAVTGLTVLLASGASAQINAKWTLCGPSGTTSITSACGPLSVTRVMMLSWISPSTGATAVVGYNIKVTHAMTGGGPLNCFWNFAPGGPRQSGFGARGHNTASGCDNFLAIFGSAPSAYTWQDLGDNRGRFNVFVSNFAGSGADATQFPGHEWYAAEVEIRATGTTNCPTGAADCQQGASLRLNEIVLVQEGGPPNISLDQPTTPNSNCVTWQAAGVCDAATPTSKATWGSLKSLYR